MKTTILYTLMIGSFLFSSCNSWLDEDPQYTLNAKTVFESEKSAQMALYGCYSSMTTLGTFGNYAEELSAGTSGLFYLRKQGNWMEELGSLNVSPTNTLLVMHWDELYRAISQFNNYLAFIDKANLRPEFISRTKGEVYFLRALAYYQLVTKWGGVPLRLSPTNKEHINEPRATEQACYDAILSDLDKAIIELKPENRDVSQIAAYALKSKTLFIMASRAQNDMTLWEKAKLAGEKVITSGRYKLAENYQKLFDGMSNKETIFSLHFMTYQYSNYNRTGAVFCPQGSTKNGTNWSRIQVSKTVFDEHNKLYPGDPRIDISYFHTSYAYYKKQELFNSAYEVYPSVNWENNKDFRQWPNLKKYWDKDQVATYSSRDITPIRYADILLLMAEVENELGNKTTALGYVNQVMTRARNSSTSAWGAINPTNWSESMTKEEIRDRLFVEREFELLGEGDDFIDARRRGVEKFKWMLLRHNKNKNNRPDQHPVWSDHVYDLSKAERNMYLPIPLKEINTNDAITESDQNKGY
ncbi:RagB/SusD family nutrient uptake outer membrane protein [Halosquirtibacter xylanolyticus]|uniref:RagB/SusD family nutrient uptake outer membrane protein n=1 Tax=Halosquirtibacter xylanolyticus TaxID=3374599 RepID=UPI003749F718|nr:RagB/SusD family nutrient uptake outer membrane protein [Prolixibacteraceae bacterium]